MRWYWAFVLVLVSVELSFAQCTPNLSGPDFEAVPDTIVNLPTVYYPSNYEATIQMYIPTDTFVEALNLVLPLDSLFITGISGLPVTFNWQVYPTAGPIPGGTPICLQITNPFVYQEEEGMHDLFIHVTAWSVGIPANGDITGYVLNVEPLPVGIHEADNQLLTHNVVSEYIEPIPTNNTEWLTIIDARGKVVLEKKLTALEPLIDVRFLSDGIYFIRTAWGTSKFLKVRP